MGQVPRISYGIIGDGRMARHMKHYFSLLDLPVSQWSRRMEAQNRVGLQPALADCEIVLVLVRDSAIEPLIQENSWLSERRLIHFSGALSTPLARGMHPLMSFGQQLYSQNEYERIPFVVEAHSETEARETFFNTFPNLPNPVHAIRPEDKALYHSLCVMGGNFTVLLWQKLFQEFERKLGIPASAANPYLNRITQNLIKNPKAAFTGPIQRGDLTTIHSNLEALKYDPYQEVYRAFLRASAPEQKAGKAVLNEHHS